MGLVFLSRLFGGELTVLVRLKLERFLSRLFGGEHSET